MPLMTNNCADFALNNPQIINLLVLFYIVSAFAHPSSMLNAGTQDLPIYNNNIATEVPYLSFPHISRLHAQWAHIIGRLLTTNIC